MIGAGDRAEQGNGLAADAEVAAANASILDQPARDPTREVAGNGETDALRGADDGRVDADHFATGVEQRATRVAGIQRRIGLDDVVDGPARLGAQGAAESADNAGGH